MKKKLDTSAVINELRGASPFFPAQQAEAPEIQGQETKQRVGNETTIPRHHDTVIPSNHDTTMSERETYSIEEVVRRAVKLLGKEAATYRFTEAEKQAMEDIKYNYKRLKIITSENEITRIGLNFVIEDYHRNGEQSILAKILKMLNS